MDNDYVEVNVKDLIACALLQLAERHKPDTRQYVRYYRAYRLLSDYVLKPKNDHVSSNIVTTDAFLSNVIGMAEQIADYVPSTSKVKDLEIIRANANNFFFARLNARGHAICMTDICLN